MPINSLIDTAIENPETDQDIQVDESPAANTLSHLRESAFINMAETEERDDDESPGLIYGADLINQARTSRDRARLTQQTIDTRKEAAAELELQIMNSDITPEAAFGTIKDMRQAMYEGVDPEDLAINELVAYNIGVGQRRFDDDVAIAQGIEDQAKFSVNNQLAELRGTLKKEFKATIPGVEDAYEFLTAAIGYGKTGGFNVANMLDDVLGVKTGFFHKLAPGNQIIEAQKIWSTLSPTERSAAIKRAHGSISRRAGLIFDNEDEAMVMMNALEAVAGSRVQAEEARVSGTTGQWVDMFLTIAGLPLLPAAKAGAKAIKKGTAEPQLKLTDQRTLDVEGSDLDIDLGDFPLAQRTPEKAGVPVRSVSGVIVDEPQLSPTYKAIGVDPLEGTYTKVNDSPRLSGTVATPSPSNSTYAPAGGVPHTGAPAFSPAQLLNTVSPKAAGPILSDAIKDKTGNIAKGLGTTRAQVAEDTITTIISGGPIRKGASLLQPVMTHSMSDAGSDAINLMHDSKLYTAAELESVKANIGKVLDNLKSEDVTLVNKSEAFVNETTGEVSMRYTIGAGGDRSFVTAAEASDFLRKIDRSKLDDLQVLRYNSSKNAYEVYTGDPNQRGEFLLSALYKRTAATGAKREDVLKNDTVNTLTNNVDSSVSYVKRMADGVSRLDIRQAQVGGLFSKILQPLEALRSKADLDDVWSVLKEAETLGDDFTQGQLSRKLGGDQNKVSAYRSVRRFYQAIYEVRNKQYRDFLSKRGFLNHTHTDGMDSWVRSINNSNKVATVWWDKAGGIVSKQSLLDKGIEIDILEGFKPRRSENADGLLMETPYIAVPKGQTNLRGLPAQVLHNKKTYLGRHLDARYVIETFDDVMVNGKMTKVGKVVAIANNPVDATIEAAKGEGLRVRRAIETTESDADYLSQEMNQMHDLQMLTNTKHRLDFEQMDVTRQNSIASPTESLDRVRNTMAKNVVLNEWIEYNTTKWIKTYGRLFENTQSFPWGGDISLRKDLATDPEALRQLARARKVRERIQLTAGIHDMQVGEKIQQRLLGAGEWLSRAGANATKKKDASLLRTMQVKAINTAAYGLNQAASVNVVNKAKSFAHLSFIIANPIRQLVMQSSSALMYSGIEHGSKYMATGAAARDLAFLSIAKSYKDIDPASFDTTVKNYMKVAGVDKSTAERFFKDFEDSGTLGSVSSHQFLEHGFTAGGSFRNHAGTYATPEAPSLLNKVAHSVKGTWNTGVRASSYYGFEAGEKGNRIAAYLAVRNKHIQNGTLDQLDATDLGTEGLKVAGNMGQYNKAAFQQGAIGLPFQFMSHSTRMIQYMMPNTKYTSWIASDVLSNQEKARVGLWNAAMFGTGGLGVGSYFIDSASDAGVEVDPLVQDALEEGLAGLALESLVEGLAGTEANINVSGTIGPLSGITGDLQVVFGDGDRAATPLGQAYKVLSDLATGLPMGGNDIGGASFGAMGNVVNMVSNIEKIWMNPVLNVGEKLELQVKDIVSLAPAVNNAFKARIMANTGEYVSKYGTTVAKVTLAEALFKGLFGIGPEQFNDIYEIQADMRGIKQTLLAPSHKELSSSGRDMATFTIDALRRLSNGNASKQEMMDRIEAGMAVMALSYEDATDRDIVKASMRKEMIKQMGSKETLADSLVKLMASDNELLEELGWNKITRMIEKVGPSEYKDSVLTNIQRIQQNEEGSKLTFEPTL